MKTYAIRLVNRNVAKLDDWMPKNKEAKEAK
jgi:hypothetical protein